MLLICQPTGLLVSSPTALYTIHDIERFITIEMSKKTELRLSHSVLYIATHICGGDLSLAQDFIASGYSLVHWPGFGHSFHYDSSGWSICFLVRDQILGWLQQVERRKGREEGGK